MEFAECGDDAGHPDRPAGPSRVRLRGRDVLVGDLGQVRAGGGDWRGLPAVDTGELAGVRIVVEDVAATADTGGLRLHQPEHQLGRHQRVGGGSAVGEDVTGRLGRQRVRGGHREVRGLYRVHTVAEAGGCGLGVRRKILFRFCRTLLVLVRR